MRLHRLEIAAFGPFAGREVIDFEPLNDAGLFLLNGVTGAGKTSVLDALCFALYGSVPGGRTRNALRSHHAEPTAAPEVELEFTAAGRRFRLTRSPYWEAPSARAASGTSTRQARALLAERDAGGTWVPRATRLDDVGELVKEVVGLSKEQFTQVILLPQGEFAEFLRASSADREAVLERLFGTAFYERVQEELAARSRTARAAAEAAAADAARLVRDAGRELAHVRSLDAGPEQGQEAGEEDAEQSGEDAGDRADGGPPGAGAGPEAAGPAVAAVRERLLAALARARTAHERLDGRLADAERRASALQDELRLRQRLAQLRREEDELDQLRPGVDEDRAALARHRAAAPLRIVLDARRRAGDALAEAREQRAGILAEAAADEALLAAAAALVPGRGTGFAEVAAGQRPPDEALRAAADEALAGVRQSRRREPELEQLASAAAELAEQVRTAERTRAGLDELASRQDADRDALDRAVAELAPRADAAPDRRRAAEDAARVLAASRELEAAAARDEQERQRYSAAERTRREAAQEAERLQQRRFEEAAGLLAADLRDGAPCPVCGSEEHPSPAGAAGGTTVSAQALGEARARRDATADDAEAARGRYEAAHEAVVRLRAGGATDDPGAAQAAAHEAAAEADRAEAAVRELAEARAGLDRLREARERTDQERHEADVAGSAARARLEQTTAQLEALAAELTAAAQGFAGLAHKEAAAERLVTVLGRVARAHDAQERAEAADADAAAQLRTVLEDSAFAGEEELARALLAPDEAQRRQERVDDLDGRALRVAAELSTPELTGVLAQEAAGAAAADPGALAAARAELTTLRGERDGSTGRLAGLVALRDRLDGLAAEAAEADAAAEAAAAEARVLRELADTANGTSSDNVLRMTLNSFVLAAQLEEVAAAATARLERMTGGRYRIVHTDAKDGGRKSGLGLQIEDAWTNARRGTESLSGGETFMASLALALGLADVVQAQAGGVEIDTLFVDEGFGSLDEETLEEVMDTIDGLRERGRVIGLVSHVQEMKTRIPHQIHVRRSPGGSTLSVRV
ncbi:AAA family ATPase [Kocuria sp. U4B]